MIPLALIIAMLFSAPAEAQLQRQLRGGSKKPPQATHFILLQAGGKVSLLTGGSLLCTGPC